MKKKLFESLHHNTAFGRGVWGAGIHLLNTYQNGNRKKIICTLFRPKRIV
jgi:hypothetical protein